MFQELKHILAGIACLGKFWDVDKDSLSAMPQTIISPSSRRAHVFSGYTVLFLLYPDIIYIYEEQQSVPKVPETLQKIVANEKSKRITIILLHYRPKELKFLTIL